MKRMVALLAALTMFTSTVSPVFADEPETVTVSAEETADMTDSGACDGCEDGCCDDHVCDTADTCDDAHCGEHDDDEEASEDTDSPEEDTELSDADTVHDDDAEDGGTSPDGTSPDGTASDGTASGETASADAEDQADTDTPADEAAASGDDTAQDTADAGDVDGTDDVMTIEEAIAYVNELNERLSSGIDPADPHFHVFEISEEDMAVIRRVTKYDLTGIDDPYDAIDTSDLYTDSAVYRAGRPAGSSTFYYDQLTPKGKALYDEMVAACESLIASNVDLSIQAYYYGTNLDPAAYTYDEASAIGEAFDLDNPQYFFANFGGIGNYHNTGTELCIGVRAYCLTDAARDNYQRQIDSVVNAWLPQINSCSTEFEKLYTIAELMSDKITYDLEYRDKSLIFPLLQGRAVCAGYATAFTYIASRAGLDVGTVRSHKGDHAWNRVKIDGIWYVTDITWLDHTDIDYCDWVWLATSTSKAHTIDPNGHHVIYTDDPIDFLYYFTSSKIFVNGRIQFPVCDRISPIVPAQIQTQAVPDPNATNGAGSYFVNLSWENDPAVDNYRIHYYDTRGNPFLDSQIDTTNNSYTIGPFSSDVTLKIVVCSIFKGKQFGNLDPNNTFNGEPSIKWDEAIVVTGSMATCSHTYGTPTWKWNGYTSATATFNCTGCTDTRTVTATVTSKVTKAATATASGIRTYTAKATFNGKTYTDTKKETIPATRHTYGEPTWTWNGYASATAAFRCTSCTDTHTVTATVTNKVTKAATDTASGIRTYTAKATFNGKTYTDTKKETIPPTKAKLPKVGKPTIRTAFGGRTVTFTTDEQGNALDSDVDIYYSFGSSNITTACSHIKPNEALFLDEPMTGNRAAMFYKAYKNGVWSEVGKWGVLNVQIAKPLIVPSGNRADNMFRIYTQTKNSYIVYSLNAPDPAIEEGTQSLRVISGGGIIWGTSGVVQVPRGRTIKVIAVRCGLVTSDVLEYKNS